MNIRYSGGRKRRYNREKKRPKKKGWQRTRKNSNLGAVKTPKAVVFKTLEVWRFEGGRQACKKKSNKCSTRGARNEKNNQFFNGLNHNFWPVSKVTNISTGTVFSGADRPPALRPDANTAWDSLGRYGTSKSGTGAGSREGISWRSCFDPKGKRQWRKHKSLDEEGVSQWETRKHRSDAKPEAHGLSKLGWSP